MWSLITKEYWSIKAIVFIFMLFNNFREKKRKESRKLKNGRIICKGKAITRKLKR